MNIFKAKVALDLCVKSTERIEGDKVKSSNNLGKMVIVWNRVVAGESSRGILDMTRGLESNQMGNGFQLSGVTFLVTGDGISH